MAEEAAHGLRGVDGPYEALEDRRNGVLASADQDVHYFQFEIHTSFDVYHGNGHDGRKCTQHHGLTTKCIRCLSRSFVYPLWQRLSIMKWYFVFA